MNLPCKYDYNPPAMTLLLAVLLFGGATAFFVEKATHNTVGLIINGVISFDPAGATAFHWVLAALSGLMAALGLAGIVQRFVKPHVLALDETAITLSHGILLSKTTRIPYASITKLQEGQISRHTLLYLVTRDGKFELQASWLPDMQSYAIVRNFLSSQVKPK